MKRFSDIKSAVLKPIYAVYALLGAWIVINAEYISKVGADGIAYRFGSGYFGDYRAVIFFASAAVIYSILCVLDGFAHNKYAAAFKSAVNHPIVFVMLATAAFRIWYYPHMGAYTVYYDTASYTNYDYNILMGEVDVFRTPIYPLFIKLIGFLTGTNIQSGDIFYENIVLAQQLLSFGAVILFYYAAARVIKSKYAVCIAALLVGCNPSVASWDTIILTESLSMTAVITFIYILTLYLERPTTAGAIVLSAFSFVMLMLRPTFIYIFAVLFVFWAARFIITRFDRRRTVAGFLTLVVCVGLAFGYCGLNKKTNDYFGLSSVGTTVNQLYMVMENKITDNPDYPEITEYIETEMNKPETTNYVTDVIELAPKYFSYTDIEKYVKGCIARNRGEFLSYTADKFGSLAVLNIAIQYNQIFSDDMDAADNVLMLTMFPFNFIECFILVLAAVVFALVILIRRRRVVWQAIGLAALIFSHLFVSIYGSMAEFSRLSIMVVPPVILLVVYFADLILQSVSEKKFGEIIEVTSTAAFDKPSKEADDVPQDNYDNYGDDYDYSDIISSDYTAEDISDDNDKLI